MSLLSDCPNEVFIDIVKNSVSIAECEKKLGYNSYSGSVANKIREKIIELNIDTSHFNYKPKKIRTVEDIFIENSTASQRTVRKYYSSGKYSEYKCDICGLQPFWNGQSLTLILDHKNGINNDHRLENLHWVCPNCNQQLPTTGSKNQAYKNIVKQKNNYCIDCGKTISSQSVRCIQCSAKTREQLLPISRDELKTLIRTKSFVSIGKQFFISDNAVRKWCDKYNLPRKTSEIKKYTDEEWALI